MSELAEVVAHSVKIASKLEVEGLGIGVNRSYQNTGE